VVALHQGASGQNDLAGIATALAPPCLLLCFIYFILTVKQSAALAAYALRATIKKGRHFLREKVHPVTWLEDFLTWK